jgi:hypothetical protein
VTPSTTLFGLGVATIGAGIFLPVFDSSLNDLGWVVFVGLAIVALSIVLFVLAVRADKLPATGRKSTVMGYVMYAAAPIVLVLAGISGVAVAATVAGRSVDGSEAAPLVILGIMMALFGVGLFVTGTRPTRRAW